MANIKSSQKKNRQRIRHEALNRAQRSAMRNAIKRVRSAIHAKDAKQALAYLAPAAKLLSRAGRRGVIKSRTASRTVSRLTVAINALSR